MDLCVEFRAMFNRLLLDLAWEDEFQEQEARLGWLCHHVRRRLGHDALGVTAEDLLSVARGGSDVNWRDLASACNEGLSSLDVPRACPDELLAAIFLILCFAEAVRQGASDPAFVFTSSEILPQAIRIFHLNEDRLWPELVSDILRDLITASPPTHTAR